MTTTTTTLTKQEIQDKAIQAMKPNFGGICKTNADVVTYMNRKIW